MINSCISNWLTFFCSAIRRLTGQIGDLVCSMTVHLTCAWTRRSVLIYSNLQPYWLFHYSTYYQIAPSMDAIYYCICQLLQSISVANLHDYRLKQPVSNITCYKVLLADSTGCNYLDALVFRMQITESSQEFCKTQLHLVHFCCVSF